MMFLKNVAIIFTESQLKKKIYRIFAASQNAFCITIAHCSVPHDKTQTRYNTRHTYVCIVHAHMYLQRHAYNIIYTLRRICNTVVYTELIRAQLILPGLSIQTIVP